MLALVTTCDCQSAKACTVHNTGPQSRQDSRTFFERRGECRPSRPTRVARTGIQCHRTFDVVCSRSNDPIAAVDLSIRKKRGAPFFFQLKVRLLRNSSHAEIVTTHGHQTGAMGGDIITRALFYRRSSCATLNRTWQDPRRSCDCARFGDHV